MYRVLYRKYRPKTFADVSGQDHITQVLRQEVAGGRLSHAYLFTGTRGTGKTTCAKILAKAVNCLAPKEGDPCCECEICRGIEDGSVFDVVEIDAASNNGVDNIRDLREAANYTPAAARYRVYIIDEVHMLSIGAFNALLKTLEEPPEHVIFILATTEVHKLPATILSRCQRFDFHRIGVQEIAARLTEVCTREGITITTDAANLIASLADGALRDALSLLDRCVDGETEITAGQVMRCAGLAGREHLFAIAEAIARRDTAAVLSHVDELYRAACDMERLCEELIGFYRDLMILRTVKDPTGLVLVSGPELERMRPLAQELPLEQILSALDVLQETSAVLKRGGSKRTELEMALVRLAVPQAQWDASAVLRRLSDLEAGLRTAPVTAPASQPKPTPPPKEAQADEPPRNGEPLTEAPESLACEPESAAQEDPPAAPQTHEPAQTTAGEGQITEWAEIVAAIAKKNRLLGAYLKGSRAFVQGDLVLIDAKFAQFREMVNSDAQNRKDIRDAIAGVLGQEYRIGPYKKPEEPGTDPFGSFLDRMRSAGATIE